MVIVTPSRIVGQEPTQRVQVPARERRPELIRDPIGSAQPHRQIKATTVGRAARDDTRSALDQTTAIGTTDFGHRDSVRRRALAVDGKPSALTADRTRVFKSVIVR
jgi:hypothetical protein